MLDSPPQKGVFDMPAETNECSENVKVALGELRDKVKELVKEFRDLQERYDTIVAHSGWQAGQAR